MKWEIRRALTTITYLEAGSIEDIKVILREKLGTSEDLVNHADILTVAGPWMIQPVDPANGVLVQVQEEELQHAMFVIPLEE
jgi:hypothetical protein